MPLLTTERTVEPSADVVTLAEFKTHARIDFTEDDAYCSLLIAAATAAAEDMTRRALRQQTWTTYFHGVALGVPEELPRAPFISGTWQEKTTVNGAWANISDTVNRSGAEWYPPKSWADLPDGSPAVRAVVVCGYADAASVPIRIKQAIKLLAAHWYEQRTPIITGLSVSEMPLTASYLLQPYIVATSGRL